MSTSFPNQKIAVFAFSADPITKGHVDILERASKLFNRIEIVTVATVQKKDAMFNRYDRLNMIKRVTATINSKDCVFHVSETPITKTTVEFAKSVGAKFLIRGIRGYTDLDYEYKLAYLNKQLSNNEIETIFIPGDPTLSMYSSTTVRELLRLSKFGDKASFEMAKNLLPEVIWDYVRNSL